MLHVALLEPEIAPNAGSAARTCLAAGAVLHLVRPLGFRLTDASLARAGMDYWDRADVRVHASYAAFVGELEDAYRRKRVFGFTTKASTRHDEARFQRGDVLLFGPESKGLPGPVLADVRGVRIAMEPDARSLNLAVAVGVGVFEARRRIRSA